MNQANSNNNNTNNMAAVHQHYFNNMKNNANYMYQNSLEMQNMMDHSGFNKSNAMMLNTSNPYYNMVNNNSNNNNGTNLQMYNQRAQNMMMNRNTGE